jgi:type II secretory pathway pseudopilin PulG
MCHLADGTDEDDHHGERLVSWPETTLTRVNVVVVAAVIATISALISTILGVYTARRNDRARQRHATEERRAAANNERLERLRIAASEFATVAIGEMETARDVAEQPQRCELRGQLERTHGELRAKYQGLLQLSDVPKVQDGARHVLRVAWNEKVEAWEKRGTVLEQVAASHL